MVAVTGSAVAAGLWMAIGVAGRRAAKKYGFLIARKKFPQLFKKVPKKDKTPDTKKTTPEKKPSTEKKKPAQTLSNEQVAKYLDLQRRRPNAFKKVPDWIKDTVRKRSAQVREQQSIAYQRGQKPSSVPKKGRKVQGGNKKAPDSAADKKEQLSPPRPKLKPVSEKEMKGKVKKVAPKRKSGDKLQEKKDKMTDKELGEKYGQSEVEHRKGKKRFEEAWKNRKKVKKVAPKRKLTASLRKSSTPEEMKTDILMEMHDLIQEHRAVTGGHSIPEEDKIHEREMGKLRSKLKKLK